jgi:hypothetical protein
VITGEFYKREFELINSALILTGMCSYTIFFSKILSGKKGNNKNRIGVPCKSYITVKTQKDD